MPIFPAKILLFGEYSLLYGSLGIACPYPKFGGELLMPSDINELTIEGLHSNRLLRTFCADLKTKGLFKKYQANIGTFEEDIEKGLYIQSSIPHNYGLGSSGMVVATVFDRYLIGREEIIWDENDILILKDDMAYAESFFHGKSSGIDPVTIYLNTILRLSQNNIRSINNQHVDLSKFYLYDTGISSDTKNLVTLFNSKMKSPQFNSQMEAYISIVNEVVTSFMVNETTTMSDLFKKLSSFQLELFKDMIPKTVLPLWTKGLESSSYFLKLCGSGGGGYLIAYTPHNEMPLKNCDPIYTTP